MFLQLLQDIFIYIIFKWRNERRNSLSGANVLSHENSAAYLLPHSFSLKIRSLKIRKCRIFCQYVAIDTYWSTYALIIRVLRLNALPSQKDSAARIPAEIVYAVFPIGQAFAPIPERRFCYLRDTRLCPLRQARP